jgi:hypothetical protein
MERNLMASPGAWTVALVPLLLAVGPARAVTVVVPGVANPWLAGMPPGSAACSGDVAPLQSPVLVPLPDGCAASVLNFSVTGSASNVPSPSGAPPDGTDLETHHCGDENGIATVTAPLSALMGVFLTDEVPTATGVPRPLDFGTRRSCDYRTLSPLLKQVFFIGDGLTSSGSQQDVIVPSGATRLLLGPMDGEEWNNWTVLDSRMPRAGRV